MDENQQEQQSPLETKNTDATQPDNDEANSTFGDEGAEQEQVSTPPRRLHGTSTETRTPPKRSNFWQNFSLVQAVAQEQEQLVTKTTDVTEGDDPDETDSTFRDEGDHEAVSSPPRLHKSTDLSLSPHQHMTFWQKYRIVILSAVLFFTIALVGALVAVLVHVNKDDKDAKNAVLTDDYYVYADTGGEHPDVFEPSATEPPPTTNDANFGGTALLKSFDDTMELYTALDEYLREGSSPQSLVAQTYGHPLHSWDISRVTHLDYLFDVNRVGANATLLAQFNQPLHGWDTSRVTSMAGTFQGAASFNQPLNTWNVAQVTNFELMFHEAHAFNGDISNWQTGRATTFWSMFDNALSFNQPIANWEVETVVSFQSMFYGASAFRQDLCAWGPQIRPEAFRTETDMFTWAESCPDARQPDMTWSPPGPFCFACE